MARDLTEAQLRRALAKYGITPALFGYYHLGHGTATETYAANAGPRRRDQLAYLIHEQRRRIAERCQN